MDGVSAAASVLALVETSLKVTSLCAEYYSQVKNAKQNANRLCLEVQAFISVLQNLEKLARSPGGTRLFTSKSLDKDVQQCSTHLEHLQKKLKPGKRQKAMSRHGIRALKWPFESKELEKDLGVLERYKTTFTAALSIDQTSLMLDFDDKLDLAEQDRCLSKLSYAEGASFDSYERQNEPYCLPDTRVDILCQIMKWSADPDQKTIFWLNGMAGTGKSTIARTITHTLAEQKRLAANFFFSRGRGDLSHAGKLFSTVAFQLTAALPRLRHYICEAIAQDNNISRQSMRDQWTKLIYQPLLRLEGNPQSPLILVFVVDALDECGRQEDIRTLLQLLTEAKDLKNVQLRVLVTSRPEIPIRLGFRAISGSVHEDLVLHEISTAVVRHDIAVFLRHELNKIKEEFLLPLNWPGKQKLELLVGRSGSLFIYAATVCRFIQDPKWLPEKRLAIVLQGNDDSQSPTQKLDVMYTQILTTSVVGDCNEKEREILTQRFRDTVGSIIVLFDSLSTVALAKLFPSLSELVGVTLDALKSVLNVPEDQHAPVQLLHPSFRDFLLNKERCLDTHFWIDQGESHHNVAKQCLSVMSTTLKRNICYLRTPGTPKSETAMRTVDQHLPYHVQYACQYWIDHLQKSNLSLDDGGHVFEFLQTHFLHWLEALSLMGKMSGAVLMIKALKSIPEFQANTDLLAFMSDAKRFVLESRYIIETAPLQVYDSALLFSPEISIVKCLFAKELPKWIEQPPIVEKNWTPSLQTLEGHSNWVKAVIFSPDGQLLASASEDNTVRLWDSATGTSLGMLEGHSHWVTAVVFSPDGHLLASASNDKTVRLWDSATGTSLGMLEGHSASVNAVVFSPDSQLLASASNDNTVRLWDSATGTSLGMLEGHSNWVKAVIFSPDGQLLASASEDNTVRLWDSATGTSLGMLEGHSHWVNAVVFSPDGHLLASASNDKTVRLWDSATGTSLGMLEGHSASVNAVVFSPDSQLLASASNDNTVRLWDSATGTSLGMLEGHSNWVKAVIFSPDGQLLASASEDNTVRLWDSATGTSLGMLEGHSHWVNAVVFSPDGHLLASASNDKTVRLWDSATGTSLGMLEGHSASVNAVVFSPDSQLLASASNDNTVRLWDSATGTSLGMLEGHSHWVKKVVFSPDGQLLASASNDNTVRLWDSATGTSLGMLEGHSGQVRAVVFSPDGQLLASASHDKTVRLWDSVTGTSLGMLKGHSDFVNAVVFSPDGQLLASASYDNTVRLWDSATGTSLGMLEGHSRQVNAVVFSPDGQLLASASFDDTVRLWDIKAKISIERIEHKYNGHLSFSTDGSQLEMDGRHLTVPSSFNLPPNRKALADASSPFSMSVKGEWVRYKDHNVLWLPSSRRPHVYAFHDKTLVLGNGSGRLTFLRFSSTIRPPILEI